ncbi:MAG TPA: glycosyltransferase family 4 protein [Rhodothermales bacterium]|nr:glycosyltransferase family 4 protein [Rhodothermales bacterium]
MSPLRRDPGRLRVLLSAYACIPGWGTEPGVGWNTVRLMAEHHDVWVLTYAGFRRAIEAELAERPVPGLHFVYHQLPRESPRHAEDGEFRSGLMEQAHYYAWQVSAARVARRLHAEVGFDVAHHVTFVKYWAPSALAGLNVPYIWGPVGGGESAPHPFYAAFSASGLRYERQRDVARGIADHDPLVRRTARRATLAFATTEETRARMEAIGARGVEVRSAIGLSEAEVASLARTPPPPAGPIRFLAIGRLIAFKGYRFGLQAFARALRDADVAGERALNGAEFWMLGEGPERASLQELARELGLGEHVRFLGHVPRPEALRLVGESHMLVHPSLHESGGGVCLEAMGAGRPVVCFDLGGSAVHVSPAAGVRVLADRPDDAVTRMAGVLRGLAADPERRAAMGRAGQATVRERFVWERKVADMAARYHELVDGPRPGGDGALHAAPSAVRLAGRAADPQPIA